jgi:hypothetical protein
VRVTVHPVNNSDETAARIVAARITFGISASLHVPKLAFIVMGCRDTTRFVDWLLKK